MNPFERFGIKEVADVQFFALEDNDRLGIKKNDIVLYLDTLKISTLETTAEQTEARGGKGNPSLIIWDYGKEITVTLQDALLSSESLAVMTAGKKKVAATGVGNTVTIYKTKIASSAADLTGITTYTWINSATGVRGTSATAPTPTAESPVRIFYSVEADGAENNYAAYEITIDAANFPGTYMVVGDTVIRNTNGKDVPFQFVIPKAKMGSEVTLTMEAEGDPSVDILNADVKAA